MKQFRTTGIVLRRTNYGEADRIVNFLTPTHGKVAAMARGVRKPKSKLSSGLEPFGEATITFGEGRGELAIVLSTRQEKFYRNILKDYDRLQFGYEAIKMVDRFTEVAVDETFYELLKRTFMYLDALQIDHRFTEVWFRMQLASLLGHAPDLAHDLTGRPLEEAINYAYDMYERGLVQTPVGKLTAAHIKLLRLARDHSPAVLEPVEGASTLLPECLQFVRDSQMN
jgi:DNA repair protein RecO (recombination protein O)